MRIFFIVFFTLYGLINFYFFIKLKLALNLKWQIQLPISFFLLIMVFAPLLIRILEKQGYESLAINLSWLGYTWMAFVVLFLFFGIITDVLRFSFFLISKIALLDLSSIFNKIPKISYFIVPLLISVILVIYGYFEAINIKTERIIIETDKIRKNTRIVQISDVHVGLIWREKRVKKIVEIISEAKPDIVVSTGDLVDAQIDRLNHLADLFKEIKPPYGKFAITGNHEFYAGLTQALSFIEKSGFVVLRDSGLILKDLNINLIGLDDYEAERYGFNLNIDNSNLLRGFGQTGYTILLKHRPFVDREFIDYFDLQLSGHTHKGQLFPFSLLTGLYYNKRDAGLIELKKGKYLYVSRGTGTWGPPIRIFAPPEITIIDIIIK